MEEEKIIHTMGDGNCGGRCIIHVHMKNGEIDHLSTDTPEAAGDAVPLTACMRGMNYHRTFLGEDRLLYPMRRIGERGEGKFERISWKEAVEIITSEWIRIRDTYGPESRYVNYGTGVSGALSGRQFAKRLLYLDGGCLGYYNSYSTACTGLTTELMYGTRESGNSPCTWLDSKLIILWSHNPLETKFDCETMYYLRKAKEKGIPILSVDPRITDTAIALEAEWIPVRPATDSALMDAMAYVILTEGLADRAFLDRCCLGFDEKHMPAPYRPDNGDGRPESVEHYHQNNGTAMPEDMEGDRPRCRGEMPESVESYLLGRRDGIPKTPEWAEAITGTPAETIRSLARRYATAKPAALIQGWGAQRNACGEQSVRGAILLACMTGNVGIPGGWAAGAGDYTIHERPSLPVGKNPCGKSIPVYRWTDALERGTELTEQDGLRCEKPYAPVTPASSSARFASEASVDSADAPCLSSNIKMLVNIAGNCLINQHGDINHTAELLRDTSRCEFIVVSDLFMTASAKFADILLPGVSMFEYENIAMPWQYGEFLGFCNQCIEPLGECRLEYDWLCEVAEGLGLREEFSQGRTWGEWLRFIYDDLRKREPELPDYDSFREAGIYRYKGHSPKIAFEKQRQDPETYPFPTASGKIELFSPKVWEKEMNGKIERSGKAETKFPAIPRYVEPPEGPQDPLREKYPLQLVGWHTKSRCHSIHNNNETLRRRDPHTLWIHPEDAAARDIKDGDRVLVYNDRGKVQVPAKVTDRIMQGVTALPQGAWYRPEETAGHPDKTALKKAAMAETEIEYGAPEGRATPGPTDIGGCINTLTSLQTTPFTHGNAQHTNLVQVTRVQTGTEKSSRDAISK